MNENEKIAFKIKLLKEDKEMFGLVPDEEKELKRLIKLQEKIKLGEKLR